MARPGEADLLDLSGLGLDVPRPNLLRNGDFRDAAYGTTFAAPANATETLTNWYVLTEAAGAVDVAQESAVVPSGTYAALRMTVTATTNQKFGLVGFVTAEDSAVVTGRTASLSVSLRTPPSSTLSFLRAAVLAWTGTPDAVNVAVVSAWNAAGVLPTFAANYTLENVAQNMPLTSSYHTFRFPAFKIDTVGAKNLAVLLWSDDKTTTAGDFVSLTNVSLVAGTQPADIERSRRVYTADLAGSAVTSAKILNGTIATANLAASAISQVVDSGSASAQTTTSTTAVEIDATVLSVTMTPVTGTVLLVLVLGSCSNNTVNTYTAVSIYKDGTTQGEYWSMTHAVAGGLQSFGGGQVLTGTAGTATTIRLRWRVSAGTATLNAGKFCVVELKR